INNSAKIQVHSTPLKVNQANLVGKLMERIPAGEALEETVVILPDEQLLFPILHALPKAVDKVNVTMGYPVRNSPAYGFLESLLELQKYVSLKEGKTVFYHKPVRSILASTSFRAINNGFVESELMWIEETNLIYIPAERLARGGEFFSLIFDKVEGEGIFLYLKKVIKELVKELDLPE